MIGLGTIINAAGVIAGGLLGLLVGKGLKPRFQDIVMTALGLSTMFISITGVVQEMLVIKDGALSSQGSFMMIAAMVGGSLIGECINIEARTEQFGEWLKKKSGNATDPLFVDGFVTASLTVCVGAMAVIGSINDGLSGDYSLLLTKAILDAVILLILTASHGKGCIFSVIPVVVLQGGITLLARWIQPVMTDTALSNLSLVGSVLIFCVGVNIAFGKRIRVANLLPSIVLAVLCAFIPWF